jgi:hypothetical protein
MRFIGKVIFLIVASLPIMASASDGYKITGRSGLMVFVAIDAAQAKNEDVYRLAVGEACAGKAICQVHYWVGTAPANLPLSSSQAESKLVNWQQNLNTGLRRWLVSCKSSNLFSNDRECM